MEPWTGWTRGLGVPRTSLLSTLLTPHLSETQREEGLVQLVASAPPAWEEEGRGEGGRAVRGRNKNEGGPGFWGRRNEKGEKETEPQKDLGNLGSTGNQAPAQQTVPSARGRQGHDWGVKTEDGEGLPCPLGAQVGRPLGRWLHNPRHWGLPGTRTPLGLPCRVAL